MDRQLTQRGEERRQQLMAFATARFAENGFHPTSVAEITEGLGVGKGVFYWYFESKEDLLRAILADAQRDLRRRQRVAIAPLDDPAARIEAGLRASMRWSMDHPDVFRLFQFAATDDRFSGGLRRGEKVAVADAARHIRDAQAAGEVRDGDPDLLAHALLGVHTHLVRLVHRGDLEATDGVIDAAVAFSLHGLLASDT
ncbi:MAG: TetR/AcrR family transcriptional regulator [Acidimicrobiales bacterium]|nr:TetR/AcrR family transcriptional regulator [Acidimicrobiales bacterium]